MNKEVLEDIERKMEDYIDALDEIITEHRNNCNKDCNFETCEVAFLCRTYILNDLKENLERL